MAKQGRINSERLWDESTVFDELMMKIISGIFQNELLGFSLSFQ
jgi:hypothetical protein